MFKIIRIRKAVYFITILLVMTLTTGIIHTFQVDSVELPVIMYHSILKDPNSTGKYVATPKSFEEDLQYLATIGYKSVSAGQIIGYVRGENDLPEKPYLLTFDDGCYNNLTYVLPLLEKYDAYAVIAIVGSYSEEFSKLNEANPAYSYLRWRDIKELTDSGRVEVANHSYDFHKYEHQRMGAGIKKYENSEEYKRIFEEDTLKTQNLIYENCSIAMDIYTYPYGVYCKESEESLIENGYVMTFTCNEGINIINRDENDIKLLKRFNRHGLLSTKEFFEKCNIN